MGVLSDHTIEGLVRDGTLGIEPFQPENLTPNGYDLTVKEILVDDNLHKSGEVAIKKGTWFALSTLEYIRMPLTLVGLLWIRTTWARRGVMASFGAVDAGFEGELTLSAFCTKEGVVIPIGERFAQIVFAQLDDHAFGSYRERSGKYHGQRGVNV